MSLVLVKTIYQILQTIGTKNETAPASDTATAGQNGRLQRIAQRLTTLIDSITSTNTKLDTANTNITATNTKLNTANTNITATNTKLDTANTKLEDIKNSVAAATVLTHNNIIVAKTAAETSADVNLIKDAYTVTAIGLAGAETAILQVKDAVTGQYFNYLTLTAAAPVAILQHLAAIVRIDKTITAASVGIVISHA